MTKREEFVDLMLAANFEERLAAMDPSELSDAVRRLVEAFERDPAGFPELPAKLVGTLAKIGEHLECATLARDKAKANLAKAITLRGDASESILAAPDPKLPVH